MKSYEDLFTASSYCRLSILCSISFHILFLGIVECPSNSLNLAVKICNTNVFAFQNVWLVCLRLYDGKEWEQEWFAAPYMYYCQYAVHYIWHNALNLLSKAKPSVSSTSSNMVGNMLDKRNKFNTKHCYILLIFLMMCLFFRESSSC